MKYYIQNKLNSSSVHVYWRCKPMTKYLIYICFFESHIKIYNKTIYGFRSTKIWFSALVTLLPSIIVVYNIDALWMFNIYIYIYICMLVCEVSIWNLREIMLFFNLAITYALSDTFLKLVKRDFFYNDLNSDLCNISKEHLYKNFIYVRKKIYKNWKPIYHFFLIIKNKYTLYHIADTSLHLT